MPPNPETVAKQPELHQTGVGVRSVDLANSRAETAPTMISEVELLPLLLLETG